jgi:hypothetical protein
LGRSATTALREIVHDPLHALPIEAHAAREPGDGRRPLRQRDRTQHLPPRAGQAEGGDEPVAGNEQAPVEPEYLEDQFGHRLAGRRALRHLTN